MDISDVNPIISYDPENIKIIAETCRTIYICNVIKEDKEICLPLRREIETLISESNNIIQDLHLMIISSRSQFPEGPELLNIIKEWESLINPDCRYSWDINKDVYEFVGKVVFSRLNCVKPSFIKS